MSVASLLVLEDDSALGNTIVEILKEAEYHVDLARDGAEASELTYDNSYDLYIFDINVPEVDGIELLKELRASGDDTPAIYITALVDLDSITQGFEAGAEDYLKKPFYPEELLMRVNARLQQHLPDTISYKDILYHPKTQEIFKDKKIVSLGSVQVRIFDMLMHNIGKVIQKDRLLDLLENPSDTALRVAMTKLKQKLEIEITNVRGVGYILEEV